MQLLKIEPRDAMLFRDSRPFGADPGANANSLPMPFPSVIAGTIRTMLGKDENGRFETSKIEDLLKKKIKGPFLLKGDTENDILFPAPLDVLVVDKKSDNDIESQIHLAKLSPTEIDKNNEGTTLPFTLKPAMPDKNIKDKPYAKTPAYWSWRELKLWLNNKMPAASAIVNEEKPILEYEKRTHISINSATGTVEESMLFSTSSTRYNEGISFLCEIDDDKELSGFHNLGGEGKLASWSKANIKLPGIPEEVLSEIKNKQAFKLQLVTPAPFGYKQFGWCPEWLKENSNGELVGNIPNISGELVVKLEGVIVGRPMAYSGWDLHKKEPKKIRWFAPPGSVYFFSVLSGDTDLLKQLWLESLCSGKQDMTDGFGLTLVGNY